VPCEQRIRRIDVAPSRDGASLEVDRGDAIDEQEGVAMRQEPLDLGAAELDLHRRGGRLPQDRALRPARQRGELLGRHDATA
jgi:hypothetical protein